MKIIIPRACLVILIGAAGAGKSTFAAKHFKSREVISSDFCRALVSDDENNLGATADAFEVLNFIAGKRLAAGHLTVVDATSVQPQARRPLIALARKHRQPPIAIVFDLPAGLIKDRNRRRNDRRIPPTVSDRQINQLHDSLGVLADEGFQAVYVLRTPKEVNAVSLARQSAL